MILDEVDGVAGTEKDSPITVLLDKILKKEEKGNIGKWPMIFICNNLYVKGLKSIRENSEIFNFRRDL